MKTQVVQLDPHDDIISTRDKLGWRQTGRILLVWPRKGRVLSRRLDLVLLTRHTASLGAQLALVTRDPDVRAYAQSLGISLFNSPQEAQQARWGRPKHWRRRIRNHNGDLPELDALREQARPQPARWHSSLAVRVILFTLGVLGVLALAAVLLPGARVRLFPETIQQTITLDVEAAPEIQQISISGLLPAETAVIEVEGRDSMPVTGRTRLPDAKASGDVNFTNLTVNGLSIPAGTIVRTLSDPPVRFETTRAVTLAAGPDTSTSVPVQALTPGIEGNLPPGRLIAIEGPLGLDVTVTNPAATRGGSSQFVPSPSAADLQVLSKKLTAILADSAQEEFLSTTDADDLVLTPEPQINEILVEEYSAEIGQPVENLELTLRLSFIFETVPGEAIHQFARQVLQAGMEQNYVPLSDSIQISNQTNPVMDGAGRASWTMQLSRPVQLVPELTSVADEIAGQPLEAATAYIQQTGQYDQPPVIDLFPNWWPQMPFLPFRIQFEPGS
jgi:hypothetical protein